MSGAPKTTKTGKQAPGKAKAESGEVLSPLKDKAVAGAGKATAGNKRTGTGKGAEQAVEEKPAKTRKSKENARKSATTVKKPRAAKKAAIVREAEPTTKPLKFEKRFIAMARRMFLSKITDEDIAATFGVDVEELEWWKEEHPDFGACFRPDPKNYGGRPTTWDERNIAIAETLAGLGATDLEIAQAFEVSIRTIHRWKLEYPEFRQALEIGKEAADRKVEDSLYKRATGYSFDSEKIVVVEGEPQRVEIIEHVPPDTKAAMWWLQNRKPGTWRDVRHIKHDIDEEGALGGWLRDLSKTQKNTFRPVDDDPEVGAGVTSHGSLPIAEDDEGG